MKSERIFYKNGDYVKIHFDDIEGDSKNISFVLRSIAREFRIGDILSIDFHVVSICIESISKDYCNALITNEGLVSSNKAVDLNREIDLRSITEKDEKAIEISSKMDVGHFALSFASDERTVEVFHQKIGNNSYLISKIECLSGLKNLQAIIGWTDALLIDRGDLSRQIPVEKTPVFTGGLSLFPKVKLNLFLSRRNSPQELK